MNEFGTPESIGESNRKLILHHLRTRGDLSRADLSRAIGMSFTAISSNVRYLLEKNYLTESGSGDNQHGRKSTLLSFNAARGHVAGVDIGRTRTRCMIADLLGRQVSSRIVGRKAGEGGGQIIRDVMDAVAGAAAKAGLGKPGILCVCVGVPGVVRDGRMYLAPYIADFSVAELRDRLRAKYDAEVLVENGVNLGAIGEHRCGAGARYSDLAYVSYGVGLGAALIIGGRLHTGSNNAAGEIGFMQLGPKTVAARFEQFGPLESAVSPERIFAEAPGGNTLRAFADALRDAEQGDRRARRVLDAISLNLAMAMTNLCAVANPQALIVSGGPGKALGGRYLPIWREHLARGLPFPPELMLSELNNRETMLGAAGTAVQYVETLPIGSK